MMLGAGAGLRPRPGEKSIRIEVETDTLAQVHECMQCSVDIIMLDNMDFATMTEAVKVIGGRMLVEASGGVSLEVIENIANMKIN